MITTVMTTATAAVTATIPITMFLAVLSMLFALAGVVRARLIRTIRIPRHRFFWVTMFSLM
jgi:hypothetical protein